ncbi:hypothetical protein Vretimale_3290 [Volvox reticuliferus]|uniref:Pherophorin domain-containing protein n=1 Tax=Volvox reticuliferus TaxID=1737510 RepID=A0A8J4D1I8_9CHLO|nr:hypothetical protein Vretifemale_20932 [Volvox reticuliferus]GIL97719.1 hypothetical protein Vretimale_3290 [Volvox reticuliferus]
MGTNVSRTRKALILLFAVIIGLCKSIGGVRSEETPVHRNLNQIVDDNTKPTKAEFPYCACETYDCGCSPYTLTVKNVTTEPNGSRRFCFSINFVGCNTSLPCCQALIKRVDKITLTSSVSCSKSSVSKVEVLGKIWKNWEPKAWILPTGGG